MNLLKIKHYINKDHVKIQKKNEKLTIINNDTKSALLIIPKIFKCTKSSLKIDFFGEMKEGNEEPKIKIVDRKRKVVEQYAFNNKTFSVKPANYFMIAIEIMANSQIEINEFNVEFMDSYEEEVHKQLNGNILLVSPGYPRNSNKYECGFVHTRVKEYVKLGWNIDVMSVSNNIKTEIYEYENVKVHRTDFLMLRNLLQIKKYDKILIHFFNDKYAQILDATDISQTKIYLYSHGADTMYRDFNLMTANYFEQPKPISAKQERNFEYRDSILNRYNEKDNVKWLFVTDWTQKHSEELNNIKYRNAEIVPCYVNENIFKYEKKSPEQRKKIFIIRKFDDINTYSIDINVRIILELSRRPFFKDLEFNIYGNGELHSVLLEPIKDFENVHIYKKFLTHEEIAKAHKENGIALFATRYDSQAVSSCEAAMSGLVVISSDNTGVYQEINPEFGTLCETENYIEYADKIEELYSNPDKFMDLSEKMHNYLFSIYSYEHTIEKELRILKEDDNKEIVPYIYPEQDNDILLTIVVPSYNVEKFLKNGIYSLINHKYANKLEVLIINDGSKDKTAEIAKELEELTKVNGKSIVKLIDKENGGHGSTINKGIELARGKYFKLMDADDYYVTSEFIKLIELLEGEETDIILNNYIEDLSVTATTNVVKNYEFMIPGLTYKTDDVCYENYGFENWGPLLSTSTYKTEMLRKADFKLSEKCFYVDMELNLHVIVNSDTIKYYPLNIYSYYIGRQGQSIAKESYIKNYKNHEKVIVNLLREYKKARDIISNSKRKFLKEKIIIPMIEVQYYIVAEYMDNRNIFMDFDKKVKEYPLIYNENKIAKRRIVFHRKTKGLLIKAVHIRDKILSIIRR